MIIYVTFPDDNEGLDYPTTEMIWPKPTNEATRPVNPYTNDGTLIDGKKESGSIPFMNRYRDFTYSDFFCEMSQGNLDVIGDEVYFRLPLNSSSYLGLGWRRNELNTYILQYIYDNLGINFEDYDNWHRNGSNWVWGGDGSPEMIVIQFRKIPPGYSGFYWNIGGVGEVGGEASLGIDGITLGNESIMSGCGITATQGINRATRVMLVPEHEMCHYIFGGFFNYGGFNSNHISVGFMTEGHGTSTYTFLPMERSMPGLDWSTPVQVNSSNLQSSYTLEDFIESGNCLKVAIPNTSPQEYFWVSNHQKKSVYDGVSRGSKQCTEINAYQQDPYCGEGKGLYIFPESDANCSNNIHGYNSGGQQPGWRHFGIDVISAEGKFDWTLDRVVIAPLVGTIGIQKTTTGNRVSGVSTFNKHFLAGYPTWSAQLVTNDECSQEGGFFVTGDFHGSGKMGYNVDYDEIFSPYSNPATNSCANPSSNSGVTFKLLSQNSTTGAITIKIYYNDLTALTDLPPAKPKNVKIEKIFFGGAGSDAFHPKITWDANIEPDFTSSTYNGGTSTPVYEIWRGNNNNCDAVPTYSFLTTVANNVTEFTDNAVTLHDPNHDESLNPCDIYQTTYSYKIVAKDNRAMSSVKSERAPITGYVINCRPTRGRPGNDSPEKIEHSLTNSPNPFNPTTNIKYSLPKAGFVTIKVYDVVGRMIRELVSEYKDIGNYSVMFDGSSFTSGIYFYRIETQDFVDTKRMVLIK